MAAMSRFSAGVRIRPQNTTRMLSEIVLSCQSIQRSASLRWPGSLGHRVPAAYFAER